MRKRPTLSDLRAQVETWNAAYPIGTRVAVKIGGVTHLTVTASTAFASFPDGAVVYVRHPGGAHPLDRVRPLPATSREAA